jgi:hypothetical protein
MTLTATFRKTDLNAIREILYAQPRTAADNFEPYLKIMDIFKYKKFLHMMYFYTLKSEDLLKFAAEKAPTEKMKSYFNHMAKEERGHYILAQEDLRAFGEEVDFTADLPNEVKVFHDYWYSEGSKNPYAFLGILYVCENISGYLKENAISTLGKLNLTKKQSRWISVHLDADDSHGRDTSELVDEYFLENAQAITEAAKKMCVLWVDINKAPLL